MKVGDLVKNIHSPMRYSAGIIINGYRHHTPEPECVWFYVFWKDGSMSNHSIEVLRVISEA